MDQYLQLLKEFWVFITTPGSKMPTSTTITVLAILAACAFLGPSFFQWRAYRKQNPMEDPRTKMKAKTSNASTAPKPNQKKKNKKKKKH